MQPAELVVPLLTAPTAWRAARASAPWQPTHMEQREKLSTAL